MPRHVARNLFDLLSHSVSKKSGTDWRIMSLCFLFASLIWLFNALGKSYTAYLHYPVTFQYDKEHRVALQTLPNVISMNVEGRGWNLLKYSIGLARDPLLIQAEPQENNFYLTEDELMPRLRDRLQNVTVNYLVTDSIHITFDSIISRTIPLRVDSMSIPLNENYVISGPLHIQPESVRFTGPGMLVKTLPESLLITLSDINPVTGNYSEPATIDFTEDHMIKASASKAIVTFQVVGYEEIDINLPIKMINKKSTTTSPIELSDSVVNLSGRVAKDLAKAIKKDTNWQATVDFKGLGTDSILLINIEGPLKNIKSVVTSLDSVRVKKRIIAPKQ